MRPDDSTPKGIRMRQLLVLLLPGHLFYTDRLTRSARRLLLRLGVGIGAAGLFAIAAGLLTRDNWGEVLAGAGFAWSLAISVWAVGSYLRGQGEVRAELRHLAELDLLHHRLNQAAPSLAIPLLNLDAEIEEVLEARMERLAHYGGLDEFRGSPTTSGYEYWAS